MKLNFKISDFNISGEPIPENIADKILRWHILPAQDIREFSRWPMWPSQKSGYRSKKWELEQGRTGTSQHCFRGKGAVDWTISDFPAKKEEFLENLITYTKYTRMVMYKNFMHCDYKKTEDGLRHIYESTPSSKWTLKRKI